MDTGFDPDGDLAAEARRRDSEDPLAEFRDRFDVPGDLYFDGNSLGPISDAAEATLDRAVEEWRELGIEAWTDAERAWFYYGESLGDDIAPLVGAAPEEVVVANATTVNIHTLIGTFLDDGRRAGLDGNGGRTVTASSDARPPGVLVNDLDFPTDHYAIRAQLRQRGLDPDEHLHLVESRNGRTVEEDDIVAAIEEREVGIVFMPSVLYRSGQLLDVERITQAAHEAGALAGFDLAHSVGVVPHDLGEHGVDFAVWCSYKYLNAGPGAIAGLYVNAEHFGTTPALAGWWGHEKETQFEMREEFTPATDAGAWQIGTVPVLSAAPLAGSLDLLAEAGIDAVREKSIALTDFLIDLVDEHLAPLGCSVGTPRDPTRRGGHVAIEHPDAERISAALRERDVVVDFRPPNVVRVCPAPLYTRFADVVSFIGILRAVLVTEDYTDIAPENDVT